MIAYLKGRVIYRNNEKSSIILETNGVGYEVFIPAASSLNGTASRNIAYHDTNSTDLSLFIYTYIREDRITLYGFGTSLQREIFNLLLEVKDVGPKLAVTILSGIDSGNFLNILTTQDISALSQIKGIGKAKAERIIMELKNKILKKPLLMNDIRAEDIGVYNHGDRTGDSLADTGRETDISDRNKVNPGKENFAVEDGNSGDKNDNNKIYNIQPADIILESSCALETLGYSRIEAFNIASKVYKNIIDAGSSVITTEVLAKECLKHIYSLKNS